MTSSVSAMILGQFVIFPLCMWTAKLQVRGHIGFPLTSAGVRSCVLGLLTNC